MIPTKGMTIQGEKEAHGTDGQEARNGSLLRPHVRFQSWREHRVLPCWQETVLSEGGQEGVELHGGAFLSRGQLQNPAWLPT